MKKKIFAALLGAVTLFTACNIPCNAQNTTQIVEMTEWNAHLYDHKSIVPVYYELMEYEYTPVDEEGNEGEPYKPYSEEMIIGFMANLEHEGNSGVVEYQFSKDHSYGFELPSGGCYIKTVDDVDYLLDWTTSNVGTIDGLPQKGSCGVSCVQWSFGRRITYLKKLKEGRYYVTEYDLAKTDVEMVFEELDPEGYYYNAVQAAVGHNKTAENYAEAFCDTFFKPKNCDLNMSTTGSSCIGRRQTAARLWSLYTSDKIIKKEITITY